MLHELRTDFQRKNSNPILTAKQTQVLQTVGSLAKTTVSQEQKIVLRVFRKGNLELETKVGTNQEKKAEMDLKIEAKDPISKERLLIEKKIHQNQKLVNQTTAITKMPDRPFVPTMRKTH
jgi:hypothetical protein